MYLGDLKLWVFMTNAEESYGLSSFKPLIEKVFVIFFFH